MAFTICELMASDYQLVCDLVFVTDLGDFLTPDAKTRSLNHVSGDVTKGSVILSAIESQEPLKSVSNLFATRNFNEVIDRPFLSQQAIKDLKHD
jgi:hypothetical protein